MWDIESIPGLVLQYWFFQLILQMRLNYTMPDDTRNRALRLHLTPTPPLYNLYSGCVKSLTLQPLKILHRNG